eukprot:4394243-Pleurochrysis_carterae.AAC.1
MHAQNIRTARAKKSGGLHVAMASADRALPEVCTQHRAAKPFASPSVWSLHMTVTRLHPSLPSASAMALPRPRDPPVTMQTGPSAAMAGADTREKLRVASDGTAWPTGARHARAEAESRASAMDLRLAR